MICDTACVVKFPNAMLTSFAAILLAARAGPGHLERLAAVSTRQRLYDRHQRKDRKPEYRKQHAGSKHYIELRRFAGPEDLANCSPKADKHKTTGNDAKERRDDIDSKRHTSEGSYEVHEPKREQRDQP